MTLSYHEHRKYCYYSIITAVVSCYSASITGMTQSQIMSEHTSQINPVSSSKRNSILEEENSNFKLKLETEEQKAQLHIEENKTLKKAVAKLEKDMLSYEENVSSLRKKV